MHVIVMRNHFTIDSNPMNAKHSQTCQHKYHLIEAIEMSEIMSKNVIADDLLQAQKFRFKFFCFRRIQDSFH